MKNKKSKKSGSVYIDAETGEVIKTVNNMKELTGSTETGYYGRKEI